VEKSENIAEIIKALIKIQPQLKPAIKDKANPFLKSKYADLSGVWDSCRDLLKESGLAVVQVCGIGDNGSYLETILMHESGQWISGKYPLKPVKDDDPQAMGSAMTYARRYNLAAILGIVTDDDDAEGAMGRQTESKPKTATRPEPQRDPAIPAPKAATQEQLNKLDAYKKAGKNIKIKVDTYGWPITKLSELTYDQAEKLINDFSAEVKK
jgi:hypothetical protein